MLLWCGLYCILMMSTLYLQVPVRNLAGNRQSILCRASLVCPVDFLVVEHYLGFNFVLS